VTSRPIRRTDRVGHVSRVLAELLADQFPIAYRFSIGSSRDSIGVTEMGKLTVRALRVVIVLVLIGSVFVQTVMVPLLAIDLDEADDVRLPVLVIVVLGIVTIQVTALCVWRLLTMVRTGTVFSPAAFRYVDIVIGAIAVACLLTFALGVTLAPGEDVAPGVVLLIGGLGVIVAGVALIVLVLRMLLSQAVALESVSENIQDLLECLI
jgi:hypothetical protein